MCVSQTVRLILVLSETRNIETGDEDKSKKSSRYVWDNHGIAARFSAGLVADAVLSLSISLAAVAARNKRAQGTAYQGASATVTLTRA